MTNGLYMSALVTDATPESEQCIAHNKCSKKRLGGRDGRAGRNVPRDLEFGRKPGSDVEAWV